MMVGARSLLLLFVGRLLLGAVSGTVFVVASAWMQEVSSVDERMWAARLTGIVLYAGFGLGPLAAGALGQWGPAPLVAPYLLHVALVAVGFRSLLRVRETVEPDRSRRIRPRLGIPEGSSGLFRKVAVPTALGVFGFPSLVFGLFPVLLRPAMAGIAVFVTGFVSAIAMAATLPTQALVAKIGPFRAAPMGLILGTAGCALGTVAFVTGAWGILFPAAVLLGAASGLSLTSGLRLVDLITVPTDRGALTGSFYAVAYAGMTMPALVASLAGPDGFAPVLSVLTGVGIVGSVWLSKAARAVAPS
jgi:MFS family permease